MPDGDSTMPDGDSTSSPDVILAILQTKLDTVIDLANETLELQRADHDRLGKTESTVGNNLRRIGDLEGAIRARTWETRLVEMLLATIASIATALGLKR